MNNAGIYASLQAMVIFLLCNSCVVQNNSHSPDIMWYKGFGTDFEGHVHEGGYIFTGHTLSYGSVNWDYLLIV
jgi:hypothetical protein